MRLEEEERDAIGLLELPEDAAGHRLDDHVDLEGSVELLAELAEKDELLAKLLAVERVDLQLLAVNQMAFAEKAVGGVVQLDRQPPFDLVDVDGLEYRESLQVVRVDGGIEGKHNVVPDSCAIVVGRRFAPCYTVDDAEEQVRSLLEGADAVEVLQAQPAAPPNLTNPLVAEFVEGLALPVRPKLGWTDVARFASRGVPAVNSGPGDPEIAHTAGELVTRDSIERAYSPRIR